MAITQHKHGSRGPEGVTAGDPDDKPLGRPLPPSRGPEGVTSGNPGYPVPMVECERCGRKVPSSKAVIYREHGYNATICTQRDQELFLETGER